MRWLFRYLPVVPVFLGALATGPAGAGDSSSRHEQGRDIYNYRCYFCHGYSGDARTLASDYLLPPPRDFTATAPESLSRETMIATVTAGKPGTAMHGFARLLSAAEIAAVVDFVRAEFIEHQRVNTRYHTPANGWPDHQRYRDAYPFVSGELALDLPQEQMTPAQARGRQLFLGACITCHDRAPAADPGDAWSKQSISYPRNNFSYSEIDAVSGASIYARHDIPPPVSELSAAAAAGKMLWQENCAFCHAADGTGENWIGSFLEPKPRNLTDSDFMRGMSRELLLARIRDGLPGTSMPAWKDVLDDGQIRQIISYIDAAFHPLERQ